MPMRSENVSIPISQSLAALQYEAPFLIDKLVMECIAETPDEARALFEEATKFLIVDRAYPDMHFQVYSRRIDEAWHQFVLFTTEYMEFCRQYFGRYVHHVPGNAPMAMALAEADQRAASLPEFSATYSRVFGIPLPTIWAETQTVSLNTRILCRVPNQLSLHTSLGQTRVLRSGRTILLVNDIAKPALEFAIQTRSFYVRELPGLMPEERVAISRVLLDVGVARMGV